MPEPGIGGKAVSSAFFEEQYRRVFEVAECRTQNELAEMLDVSQPSISGAKGRHSIPDKWLMNLLLKKRVNPEWILSGEGSRYLVPTDAGIGKPAVVVVPEIRPPQQCSAQELVNELVRRSLNAPLLKGVLREIAEQMKNLEANEDAEDCNTSTNG